MPKILPWRTKMYPCIDCGRAFLPPVGSQRSLVMRTGKILCVGCKDARAVAYDTEIIPCDHCGQTFPRQALLYGKSYKNSQMVCPPCYELQHDPFDEPYSDDPETAYEEELADREAGYWW